MSTLSALMKNTLLSTKDKLRDSHTLSRSTTDGETKSQQQESLALTEKQRKEALRERENSDATIKLLIDELVGFKSQITEKDFTIQSHTTKIEELTNQLQELERVHKTKITETAQQWGMTPNGTRKSDKIDHLTTDIKQKEIEIANNANEIGKLRAEIAAVRDEATKKEQKMGDALMRAAAETSTARADTEIAATKIDQLKSEIETMRGASQARAQVEKRAADVEEEIEALRETIRELEAAKSKSDSEHAAQVSEIEKTHKIQVGKLETRLAEVLAAIEEDNKRNTELQKMVSEAKLEVHRLTGIVEKQEKEAMEFSLQIYNLDKDKTAIASTAQKAAEESEAKTKIIRELKSELASKQTPAPAPDSPVPEAVWTEKMAANAILLKEMGEHVKAADEARDKAVQELQRLRNSEEVEMQVQVTRVTRLEEVISKGNENLAVQQELVKKLTAENEALKLELADSNGKNAAFTNLQQLYNDSTTVNQEKISELEVNLKRYQDSEVLLNLKLEQTTQTLATKTEEVENLTAQITEVAERNEKLQLEADETNERFEHELKMRDEREEEYARHLTTIGEERDQSMAELEIIIFDLQEKEKHISELEENLVHLKTENAQHKSDMINTKRDLESEKKLREKHSARITELEQELQESKKDVAPNALKITELETKLETKNSEAQELMRTNASLSAEISELEKNINSLSKEQSAKNEEFENTRVETARESVLRIELEAALNRELQKNQEVTKQLETEVKKNLASAHEITQLQDDLKATNERSNAVEVSLKLEAENLVNIEKLYKNEQTKRAETESSLTKEREKTAAVEAELLKLKSKSEATLAELEQQQITSRALQTQLDTTTSQSGESKNSLHKLSLEIENLKSQKEKQLNESTAKLTAKEAEISELNRLCEFSDKEIQAAKLEITNLKQTSESEKAQSGKEYEDLEMKHIQLMQQFQTLSGEVEVIMNIKVTQEQQISKLHAEVEQLKKPRIAGFFK